MSPPFICRAPRPSEVADPNRVAKDRQDVYSPAHRTVDPLTQKRIEHRTDQIGHALAEGEVGECQSEHGVHGPWVKRPVEVRVLHRHLGSLPGVGLRQPLRRSAQVVNGLCNPVEHQPNAHPRAEHHSDRRAGAKLRSLVLPAQPDLAVTAKGQIDREGQKAKRREYEYPPKVCDHKVENRPGDGSEVVRGDHSPRDERR